LDGKTTLYLSAGQAKFEAVQYLLDRDVSVKVVDNVGVGVTIDFFLFLMWTL
jgi:hypothetical protein